MRGGSHRSEATATTPGLDLGKCPAARRFGCHAGADQALSLSARHRGIAAAIGDPKVERVTVLKSARIGYSAMLTGALAHFVVCEPSPILVLMPTEADCRDYMVSDIEPLFLTDLAVATNSHTMNATEEIRLCPICGMRMRLARITPRLGGLSELQTLECRPCKFVVTAEQDQNPTQS